MIQSYIRSNNSGNQKSFLLSKQQICNRCSNLCNQSLLPLACAVHSDLAGSPETLAVVGAAGGAPHPRRQEHHRHCDQHDLGSSSHHVTSCGLRVISLAHTVCCGWCPLTEPGLGSHRPPMFPTVPAGPGAHWRHLSQTRCTGDQAARRGQIIRYEPCMIN